MFMTDSLANIYDLINPFIKENRYLLSIIITILTFCRIPQLEAKWKNQNSKKRQISTFLESNNFWYCRYFDGVLIIFFLVSTNLGITYSNDNNTMKALTLLSLFFYLVICVIEMLGLHKYKLDNFYADFEK